KWKKPETLVPSGIRVPNMSDNFSSEKLGHQWQWQANYKKEWYELKNQKLKLHAINQFGVGNLYHIPNILTQKFPAETFNVQTKLSLVPEMEKDCAGLL